MGDQITPKKNVFISRPGFRTHDLVGLQIRVVFCPRPVEAIMTMVIIHGESFSLECLKPL